MSLIAPLAAAAGLAAVQPSEAAAAETGEAVAVELVYQNGRILAPATFEGVGERWLIVDTAAGLSVVTPDLRAALEIDPDSVRSISVQGATGGTELDLVPLTGLAFAGQDVEGVRAAVAGLGDLGAVDGTPVAGILGVDILSRWTVKIDIAAGRLTLAERGDQPLADAPGVAFNSVARTGLIQFTADLKGESVTAVLDTGAPVSIVNWPAAALAGLDRDSEAVRFDGAAGGGLDGGSAAFAEAELSGLCAGTACFQPAPARIGDLPVFAIVGAEGGDGPSMLVGADLLEQCAVMIDYDTDTLRFCV